MAIPLILAGAGGIVAGLHSAASASRPFVARFLKRNQADIEHWALKNAFEAMGLPDLSESPSRADFTDAINQKFLSGSPLQLSDVFDSRAIREDAMRYAMAKAAADLGIAVESPTVAGVRDALRGWVRSEVVAQLGAEAGDMIEGAADHPRIAGAIAAHNAAPPKPGLLMTPEAISNRERQARYRAGKTKHWEPRASRYNPNAGGES